jgi:hypothetical protein
MELALVKPGHRRSFEIRRQNIQAEFRWVPGHAGIEGNETANQFEKDAAVPENEEELPSEEDRVHSLAICGGVYRCEMEAFR